LQRLLGRFELAEGGTFFLDEVGELSMETQIALLRVLQEHEFERVGGTRSIQTNVRVVAATNRNLQVAFAAGTFRSDLFYRLNVFPIEIATLRERREDIPVLVEYFIDRCARNAGKNIRGIEKNSLDLLQSYPWPGNIRELQNVIERSVIMCETENFSVDKTWLAHQPLATGPKIPLELSEKLAAVHPGGIQTELDRHLDPVHIQKAIEQQMNKQLASEGKAPFQLKTIPQRAATSVWAAVVAPADEVGGRYCENCHVGKIVPDDVAITAVSEGVRSYALDPKNAEALWKKSGEMVRESF
jgi:transcriptional regulator with PAS, ATPase and Fis domain